MKLQDKMSADQLWVRSHSYYETFVAPQTPGYHFPVVNAPNFEERNEMTIRTLARRFDWDLEKFRLSKKPADKGNRRRHLKNISKFIKNPFGYIVWRYARLKHRPRTFSLVFAVISLATLQRYAMDSQTNDRFDEWKQANGQTMEKSSFQITGHRRMQLGIPMVPLYQMLTSRGDPGSVVLNPTYRQNFRLYFDRLNYSV
jgi:hypothetical protein